MSMHKIVKSLLLSLGIGTFVLLLIPKPGLALSASVVSITPTAEVIDMNSDDGEGPPPGIALFGWLTTPNTQYTATFDVDVEPVMVVAPGADLKLGEAWSYDEDAKQLTVNFTAKVMIGDEVKNQMPEGYTFSMIAIVPAVAEGEDGPPEAFKTGWMATNLQEWELIPPSPGKEYFGYKLTGPEGETGFFHMFIPDAIIELLGKYSGKEMSIDELAVFNGDQQASMSIEKVEGGAYVSIKVLFTKIDNAFVASSAKGKSASSSITKMITVREQQTVSMTAKKTTLKKGKTIQLFGWLKNGKKDQAVMVYQKKSGEKAFTKVTSAKTKKNGYYTAKVKADSTATYKVKYGTKESSTIRVTVKK